MLPTARRIVLARPIAGVPTPEDFRLEEVELPPLEDGQFRVRNLYVSADPGTRSRLSGAGSYAAALKPGEVIDGFAVGTVEESLNPAYPVGALVTLGAGWATHTISRGRGYCARLPDRPDIPASAWIGVLGVPGMTAWFGLTRVAGLKPGERVLVTSAAGPVGATAGQLARAFGASRVVGVAGGLTDDDGAKARWLSEAARFDALIDHRAPDFDAAVAAAMPEGVDVLFDNVGNAMIDRLIPLMRPGGRIVISGQVADYNLPPEQRPGIHRTAAFITHRLRMEGLVVFDDLRAFPEAQGRAADLIAGGQLQLREIVGAGIESLPGLFCDLFVSGAAFGRRIARL